MKNIWCLGLTACLCVFLAGFAAGQDYYGGYSPYQGQEYGNYGSSGYGQPYPNTGQGSSYGYGSPYGYAEPSSPQGYQGQYGYDQYPGVPGYGRYENTPYGSGTYNLPSASPRASEPTLRSRLTPPQVRGGIPEVRETTRVVTPSRRQTPVSEQPSAVNASQTSEGEALFNGEIYWDGRDSQREQSSEGPTQSQPVQSLDQGSQPRRSTAVQQTRPSTNLNNQTRTQRTRPNVVRQEPKTASSPPPPPTSGFKWGKEQPSVTQQREETRPSLKWGMQGKPSMVGSEPGRSEASQGSAQVSAQSPEQSQSSSLNSGSKKFQWGKIQ